MTKILHTADIHLDTAHHSSTIDGKNVALESNMEVLKFIADTALEKQPDALIISGDLTDNANPSSETILRLIDTLQPVLDEGIQIHLDEGNHERYGLKFAHQNRSNVDVLRTTLQLTPPAKRFSSSVALYRYADFNVISVNYPFRTKLLDEMGLKSNADSYDKIAEYLTTKIHEALEDSQGVPTMLSGHFTTTGFSTGGSEQDLSSLFDETVIGVEKLIELSLPYVGLGHIHTPQKIADTVHYVGSPNKLTFTDARDHKAINYVNLDTKEVERIYTPTRGLYKASLENFTDLDLSKGDAVQLLLPADEPDVPANFKQIAKEAGALIVPKRAKVIPQPRSEERIVIAKNTDAKSALKQHLKSVHCLNEEEITNLVTLATQILEETE